jgi:hypothetical protein
VIEHPPPSQLTSLSIVVASMTPQTHTRAEKIDLNSAVSQNCGLKSILLDYNLSNPGCKAEKSKTLWIFVKEKYIYNVQYS